MAAPIPRLPPVTRARLFFRLWFTCSNSLFAYCLSHAAMYFALSEPRLPARIASTMCSQVQRLVRPVSLLIWFPLVGRGVVFDEYRHPRRLLIDHVVPAAFNDCVLLTALSLLANTRVC